MRNFRVPLAIAAWFAASASAQGTGPVAAYSFDEGAGLTAADRSGNGNHGTLTGGTTWSATGKFGSAASFDGSNDRIDVPDANSLDLTSGMTLEAWVRPTASGSYRTVVLKEVTGELAYSLYAADSDHGGIPSGWSRIANVSYFADGTGSLPLNVYSHLAVTYNGGALVFYVNGVATRSSSAVRGNIQTSSMPLRIGGNTIWGEYFQGQIDEVRIYNRALSQDEIQADMVTPVGGTPAPSDTTAPTVSLTAPGSGALLSGTATVSADASDAVGVVGVQFKLDGVNLGSEDTSAPYSLGWNTLTTGNGAHSLTAVARDAAGNTATSAARAVTVNNAGADTQAPTVSLTTPVAGARVSGTVSVAASASDNVGVAGVQFRVDGANLGSEDPGAPYSRTWDSRTAVNGAHSLTAVARDAAGNVVTSAVVSVTVDNGDAIAPSVSLTSPASGATLSGTVTLAANASDDVGVVGVQFRLDGSVLGAEDLTAPYSAVWATTASVNGSHQLTATARDAAGNTTTSAARTVTVSNGGGAGMPLTIDGSLRFQTIDGFGVSANSASWDGGALRPAIDRLVDEGGATIWRVVIEMADWEATNDDANPNTFNWTYYNSIYSSPKFEELWATLAYLNQKGVTNLLMLNFMGRGPAWMGGPDLPAAMEDEWVETVASVAYYARNNRHIQFGLFAPDNEPDWDGIEGIRMDRWQYARVMRKLALRLEVLGLGDLRLVGPDAAAIATGVNGYLPALMGEPAAMAKLDHFGFHDYAGDSGGADSAIRNSAWPAKNFWITEVSNIWDALAHLSQGPAAILVWDGYDSVYNHAILAGRGTSPPNDAGNGPALLAYSTSTHLYTPRRSFYEFAQLFRFVPAGSVRVSAVESASTVTLRAFHQPVTGRVTLMGRNSGSADVTFSGRLVNLPVVPSFELYRTSDASRMQRGADVAVTNGTFSFVAAGNSVFTLTYSGPADTLAPTVSVTAPATGAVVSGTVTVASATATDDVGIRGVQFRLDGALLGVEDTSVPFGVPWNTAGVANGSHTLIAVARDWRGNVTTSDPVVVTANN